MHFARYLSLFLALTPLSVYRQLLMQSTHFFRGLNRFMVSNFHRDCMHVLSGMLRHHHSSEGCKSKSVSGSATGNEIQWVHACRALRSDLYRIVVPFFESLYLQRCASV